MSRLRRRRTIVPQWCVLALVFPLVVTLLSGATGAFGIIKLLYLLFCFAHVPAMAAPALLLLTVPPEDMPPPRRIRVPEAVPALLWTMWGAGVAGLVLLPDGDPYGDSGPGSRPVDWLQEALGSVSGETLTAVALALLAVHVVAWAAALIVVGVTAARRARRLARRPLPPPPSA